MAQKIAKTLPWIAIGFMTVFSGCNYATSENPGRVYGDASASAPAKSPTANDGSDVAVAPEGESQSEGEGEVEVIVPEPETPVSTPPAPGGVVDDGIGVATPPVETPSTETPTVVGTIDPGILVDRSTLPGGAVLTNPPVITLPPAVSCDVPSYAFVSKRSGALNVYAQREGSLTKQTSNDTSLRSYGNLQVRKGGQEFSSDEVTLLVLIPVIRTAFGSLEEPEALATLSGEGTFTRGFAWNHEGTKAAYFRMTPERGRLSTAIHYVTNLETMETHRDMVVDPYGDYRMGQIAWWSNKLVQDVTVDGRSTISVIDPERYPVYIQPVALVASESPSLDARRLEGKQPAVSVGGLLAFIRTQEDGRDALATCRLEDVPGAHNTARQCAGLRVLSLAGNSTQPAFSPDGRWLYFVSDRDGNKEIYRIRPDGTGEECLTNNAADDTSPAPFAPSAGCE